MTHKFEDIFLLENGTVEFKQPILVGGNLFTPGVKITGEIAFDGVRLLEQKDKMVQTEENEKGVLVFQAFVQKDEKETKDKTNGQFVELSGKKVTLEGDNLRIKIE